MIKPDLQVARCLSLLRNTSEFRPVRQWIGDSLAEVDKQLRTATGDKLLQLQGEAQCLEQLARRIDESRDIANKLDR